MSYLDIQAIAPASKSAYISFMPRVYLDYSATTPLDPRVFEAMRPHFLENFGNASSVHESGRKARAALEDARETIAQFIGSSHDTVFFTSGGTESDNYAVQGITRALKDKGKNHIVVSAIEHHAILHPALALREDGWQVDTVRVDSSGLIDLDHLTSCVSDKTALVSVMHANNEVGTIQPLREVSEIAHRRGALVHSDAVQSLGKIPVKVDELAVDLISASAHKIYGPKGTGVLFIRKGTPISSILVGGGQEQNRRAGTENVPLAVGFASAVQIAGPRMNEDAERLRSLRETMRSALQQRFPGLLFNGHPERTLPNILNISFDASRKIDGEALIIGMDLRGVAVTSGSACTSGTLEPSHVLMAMGRDEATARSTIRFSFGRQTTGEEIDFALDALEDVVSTMMKSDII